MKYIYLLTNTVTGKQYIGQTCNIKTRMAGHRNKKGCPYIGRAIRKYGFESFTLSLLFASDDRSLINFMEEVSIQAYGTLFPNGYNLRNGGRGSYHHEESRRKISIKAKEQFSSPEAKIQAAIRKGGRPFIVKDLHGNIIYRGVNKTGCCRELGLRRSSLQLVLTKKYITTEGVHAKYEDDTDPWPTEDLCQEFNRILGRLKAKNEPCPTWYDWVKIRIA